MNQSNIPQLDLRTWQSDGRPVPVARDGTRYLIGGEIREWNGPVQEVQSCLFFSWNNTMLRPSLGAYALLDEAEAMRAVDAAEKAWDNGRGPWPTTTIAKRIEAMEAFVERMKKVREVVVERMMWEIGKTQADSFNEFDRTVKYILDTIEALKNIDREAARFNVDGKFIAQIRRSPLGPTLCMGPYNYPLNETFATLIPAVLMGNPVVSKLPRYGTLLNTPLLEAFRDCFPPGVVNIISGRGNSIITPIMRSGRMPILAFIGNSRTADSIKSQYPHPHRLRSVLSLDAKNPAVVLADADMSITIPQLLAGALSFNGQRCTALKIIFVHKFRVDEVLDGLSKGVSALQAGHPWVPGVKLTPIADIKATDFLVDLLNEAKDKGAEVMNPGGGERIENYIHPAVLYPVHPSTRLALVEQFGPLIPVRSFERIEEVLEYMQQAEFGQQVALFGQDPHVLGPLIDGLMNQVSRVNINTQCQRGPDTFPFTGRKASAEGTLSVTDALKRFSMRTLVATDYSEKNRELVNEIIAVRSSQFLRTDFLF